MPPTTLNSEEPVFRPSDDLNAQIRELLVSLA